MLFLVNYSLCLLGDFWRHRVTLLLFLIVSTCVNANASTTATPLRIAISNAEAINSSEPSYYFEQLLRLSLEKTYDTDGNFQIVHNHHGGGIERDRALLMSGVGIDVMWGSVTKEREKSLRVIPVDLLKTLNNYRVLLIRNDNQNMFNKIENVDGLKKIMMGSGAHWTDTAIMSANGFSIMEGTNYSGLFKMLAAGRFDFMSRGVHEAGYDMAAYASFGLALENKFLLKYDTPLQYSFYVNKNNIALSDRIERGLKIAQQDGSFDALFYQIPSLKNGMDLFKSSTRTVIELKTEDILNRNMNAEDVKNEVVQSKNKTSSLMTRYP